MRLRIDFGTIGGRKEVTWWQPLEDFPTALIWDNQHWEWVMYSDDAYYDKILTFGHMSIGDSRWYSCVDFDQRFEYSGRSSCECGSIHTSAAQFHMFYCPMWRKQ